MGLANLVLKFSSPSDALFFQRNFITYNSKSNKIDNFIARLDTLINNKESHDRTKLPLSSFVFFILNYIPYFFISWERHIDLHQYVYGSIPSNYSIIEKLCHKYLEINDPLIKDVYARHFCLMINYYNLHGNDDALSNKKFIYESILGNDTENIMLAKIISLFSTNTTQNDSKLEYLYIIDDIRLIKDPQKKFILLKYLIVLDEQVLALLQPAKNLWI